MNFSISATNAVILAHIGARLETPEGLPEAQVLHITALEDYGEHLSLERDRREFNANPQGSSLKIYTDPSKIDPSIKPALKTWSFVYGGCRMGKVSVLDMYPVNLFHKWSLWLIGCKLARPMTFGRALKVLRTEYTNNLKIKNALDRAAANLKKGEALDIRFSGEIAPAYAPQYVNNAQALEYAIKRLAAKLPTFDHNAEPINTESKFSLELVEESSFASKTAHFEESKNNTGFARVTLDGRDVGRVRTWSVDEATESNARDALYKTISSFGFKTLGAILRKVIAWCAEFLNTELELNRRDEIKTGKVKECAKPSYFTRKLGKSETHHSRFESATFYGIGTPKGERWFMGKCDFEHIVMTARSIMNTRA